MKRIVVLTNSELRHTFFRKQLALGEGIEVVNTYCEGQEKNLNSRVTQEQVENDIRINHLQARRESENDFFQLFVDEAPDKSNPLSLPSGDINLPTYIRQILDSAPDLIVAYGCSIVKGELLTHFKGRFLNVHLGLSPYYRGSGTNYWPLVNNEPEYVGATFMYIDAGIDTGEVIHQIRARYAWGDTPSQVGNRLIRDMTRVYRDIIVNFDKLEKMEQTPLSDNDKVFRMKDYSQESVAKLYQNFSDGLIGQYINNEAKSCHSAPIIENPCIRKLVS